LDKQILEEIDKFLESSRALVAEAVRTNENVLKIIGDRDRYSGPLWKVDGESDPLNIPSIEKDVRRFVTKIAQREYPNMEFDDKALDTFVVDMKPFTVKGFIEHLESIHADKDGIALIQLQKAVISHMPRVKCGNWCGRDLENIEEWPMRGKRTLVFRIYGREWTVNQELEKMLKHIDIVLGGVKPTEATVQEKIPEGEGNLEHTFVESYKAFSNSNVNIKFRKEEDAERYKQMVYDLWLPTKTKRN
jgi:hypothetical protein